MASSTTDCLLEHLQDDMQGIRLTSPRFHEIYFVKGISVLSLNRPSVKNAIGRQMLQDLQQHIANLKNNQ
jgi:hypothetical protein